MKNLYTQYQKLAQDLQSVRKSKKIVFTNGCFDILHVGHVRYLEEAKNQGDLLVIGLNSDASIQKLKGSERPIIEQESRAELLLALKSVDYVCVFTEDTPYELIKAVQPDVLVKGGDWPVDQIVGSDLVLKAGGEVKSLQFVTGKSTTNIVEKIKALKNE